MTNVNLLNLLENFLSIEGNSLLIKGKPGMGKTTLLVTLLRNFLKKGRKIYYFSTRVFPSKLMKQLPMMEEITIKKPDLIKDTRLITLSFLLEKSFEILKQERVLVVYDSWDALVKEQNKIERLKVEKSICSTIEHTSSNVVFISEEPELTTVDYLVDGIIYLYKKRLGERFLRIARIEKLRGITISHPYVSFTLKDGIFKEMQLLRPENIQKLSFKEVKFKNERIEYSNELNELFEGGIKFGSIILFEYSTELEKNLIRMLLAPILFSFIKEKHKILYTLSADSPVSSIKHVYQKFFDHSIINQRILFNYDTTFKEAIEEIYYKVSKLIPKDYIIVLETIPILDYEDKIYFLKLIREIKDRKDLLILIVHSNEKFYNDILPYVDNHIKIYSRYGSIYLLDAITQSKLYSLMYDETKNRIDLIDIV